MVTATGRAVRLQDAPAAVTAFTAYQIEDAGIRDVNDYVGLTPGVTVVDSHASAFGFILIRGIYQVRNTDSSVAYVMDDVLNTSPFGFKQELFDVEQIELLKGPQGALYGRNAVGGAILIKTKDPTNENEGFVRVRGGNGDTYGTEVAVSGPIIDDKLLFRVAGFYEDSRGFIENITLNEPSDPHESVGLRTKFIYTPNDTFKADWRFSFDERDAASELWTVFSPFFSEENGVVPVVVGGNGAVPDPNNPFIGDIDNIPPRQANVRGHDSFDGWSTSLKLEWDLPDILMRSVTAYDTIDQHHGGDNFPYTSARELKNDQNRQIDAFSQDLRLISTNEEGLRWMGGVYFASTDYFISSHIQLDETGDQADEVEKTPIVGQEASILLNADDAHYQSYAAFGQLQYDVSDDLELTVSLRYDYEDREVTVETPTALIPAGFEDDVVNGAKRDETFDAFQPKVTLRYEINDNWTAYANYSHAFRSGGFNPTGVREQTLEARLNGDLSIPPDIYDTFDQEDTRGFDAGLKAKLLDGAMNLNMAVYHTQVENQFLFSFLAGIGNSQNIRNIDESEINGFEIDAIWNVTSNIQLYGGYSYTDTEVKKYEALPEFEGNALPLISEDDFVLGVQVRQPLGEAFGQQLTGMIRLDWNRIGETQFDISNVQPRGAVGLVNMRASLDVGEDFTISAFGTNLTDEAYYAEVVNPPGLGWRNPPRKWGVELTKRF